MVGLYTLLGAPKPSAVVAVLAYRLLSFWIPTLVGVALIPYLERGNGSSSRPTGGIESGQGLDLEHRDTQYNNRATYRLAIASMS